MSLFMLPSLVPFCDVTRLRLEVGDTLVLSSLDRISPTAAKNIASVFKSRFPDQHVLVLDRIKVVGVLAT